MATLERTRGRLRLVYDTSWQSSDAAFPLSLSMPLAQREHKHDTVEAFLWGLLPDNERVLERWAREFQASARSPFELLAHVGEDCAGAVQLAREDRVHTLLSGRSSTVSWLTESQIAERLKTLREDHAAWRAPNDVGQFSLAGAQPKTAFLIEDDRIGVPGGRTPTTHILKPPTEGFDGHAENEHLCLALARALGLTAARSTVRRFVDEVAIVVERFDRVREAPGRIARIHQEDLCQALARPPTLKYQSEGGPTPAEIAMLLRTRSSDQREDVQRFADALIFNWLIGGSDAHAKNYALLLGGRGEVRLAPLYDLGSALPYPKLDARKLKLAMKIGSSYRLHEIGAHHLRKLAEQLGLDKQVLIARAAQLAQDLPEHAERERQRVLREGLAHPIIDRLTKALIARAKDCIAKL